MTHASSTTLREAQRLEREIERRLAGLVTAPVRCIPDVLCPAPKAKSVWSGQWTRAEQAAARYYEDQGFEVVRLQHFPSTGVGQPVEKRDPDARQLGDALRRILPPDAYARWTIRATREELTLASVYPHDYPVSGYVPDFLLSRGKEWRLVEVKGPGDKLHPRQANWLINLCPKEWQFEVCATFKQLAQPVFIDAPVGKAAGFEAMMAGWVQEVDDTRAIAQVGPYAAAYQDAKKAFEREAPDTLSAPCRTTLQAKVDACHRALIDFENSLAAAYTRRFRASYVKLKGESRYGWTLPSGRPISAIDPEWPPAC